MEEDNQHRVLRIDFPGYGGEETLESISWEAIFDKFERENLAFLYQDETSSGGTSRFFKFVDRHSIDTKEATRMNTSSKPPTKVSDEAKENQLQLARQQGDAYKQALMEMVNNAADDGGEQRAGDYIVAYAVEKAEGLYELRSGELTWQEPQEANCHIEVSVRDGADGRFIPGLEVQAKLIDANGNEVGTHQQHFLWHPWLYHYGRNWRVPGDGKYTLQVRIEPPQFARHDKKNGKRYAQPVSVEFSSVQIKTGRK